MKTDSAKRPPRSLLTSVKKLVIFAALCAVACAASAKPKRVYASPILPKQILDSTHLERHQADEVEIIVVREGHPMRKRSSDQLIFQLDRKAIARLYQDQLIRFYLPPGRHRFGVIPASNPGLYRVSELEVEIGNGKSSVFRIFQTGGFTSSGGKDVFDIASY